MKKINSLGFICIKFMYIESHFLKLQLLGIASAGPSYNPIYIHTHSSISKFSKTRTNGKYYKKKQN